MATRPLSSLGTVSATSLLAALLGTPVAAAAPGPLELDLAASADQHAFAVRVEPGAVLARACRTGTPCGAAGGQRFALPAEVASSWAQAELEAVELESGKRLAQLVLPEPGSSARWVLLLGATPEGEPPAPVALLKAWLGRPKGEPGERVTNAILRERRPRGIRLAVGKRYEHLTVCGRPATVGVRELDPVTLRWRSAGARSLSNEQQSGAVRLLASRLEGSFDPTAPRLLHAVAASSSASGSAAGLTDGDPSTRWAEGRPGPGLGEFVLSSSSSAVAITGFELVLRPVAKAPPEQSARPAAARGAAPRTILLATAEELFAVELREDAWLEPAGTRYRVDLPRAVNTSCVALVLADVHGTGVDAEITVAELRARTELDGLGWPELVDRLAAASPEAAAAAALLSRGGPAAIAATMQGYERLQPKGRARALDVIDAGSCTETASFYAARLVEDRAGGSEDRERIVRRAERRLRSCGPEAAEALGKALTELPAGAEQAAAAAELALIAPRQAVGPIVELLGRSSEQLRRQLRGVLSTAARMRRARPALERALEPERFASRSLLVRIDLLRAIGPELEALSGARGALQQILSTDRSFRTRYLLQVPAGHLGRGGDPVALDFVRQSLLGDPSQHVRAQAARASAEVPALGSALRLALRDRGPRVRQAALEALRTTPGAVDAATASAAAALLRADPWTFVRQAAARALEAAAPSTELDAALLEALEDPAPLVRARVLHVLGARRAIHAAEDIRDVADDPKESTRVRVAAIRALGALCDAEAVDLLTKLAVRAGATVLPYDRPLGLAALGSLGAIGPADLGARIRPLLHPRVPMAIRQLAQEVLSEPGACRAR